MKKGSCCGLTRAEHHDGACPTVVSGSWATSHSQVDDEFADHIRRLHHHLTQMASVSGFESWSALRAECPLTHKHHVQRALVRMQAEDAEARRVEAAERLKAHQLKLSRAAVERYKKHAERSWQTIPPTSDAVCTPVQTHATARVRSTAIDDETGEKYEVFTEYGSELSVVAQELRNFTAEHVSTSADHTCQQKGKSTHNCPACRAWNTLNFRYTEEFGRGYQQTAGPWLIGMEAISVRLTHEHDCVKHQWPNSYDRTTVLCPANCPSRRVPSYSVWLAEHGGWEQTARGKNVTRHSPLKVARFRSEAQAHDLFDRLRMAISHDEMNRKPDEWEFHPGESTPYAPESIDLMAEDDGRMALQ